MTDDIDLGIDDLEQFTEIGSGGFATVYAAWDPGFHRWVAVKVLHALDDAGKRRFDRERGLMGLVGDNMNVVTPFRFGYTATGRPYLVMEYLRGGSLKDLVDRHGPVPPLQAVDYVLPVARALGQAHAAGVLHRDVKPDNILLTDAGVPKITDFGISAIQEVTSTQVAYTLAHTAPESFANGRDERDERSDLYSLASTLFTLVTGRSPFQIDGHDSELAYLRRVESQEAPATGVAILDPFLLRALAKDPAARPQTADQFAAELSSVRAALVADPSPTPVPPSPIGLVTEISGPPVATPSISNPSPPTEISGRGLSAPGGFGPAPQRGDRPQTADGVWAAPASSAPQSDRGTSGSSLWWWAMPVGVAVVAIIAGLAIWQANDDEMTAMPSSEPPAGATTTPSPPSDTTPPEGDPSDPDSTVPDPAVPEGTVVYVGHTDTVEAVVELGDGRLASASKDGTVLVWPAPSAGPVDGADVSPVAAYDGHGSSEVYSLAALSDGRIASGATDGTVHVWDPDQPGDTAAIYEGHTETIWAVIELDDGRLASASSDGTVQMWDPDQPETTIDRHTDHAPADVFGLVQLADGRVASGGADSTVHLWDPDDPGEVLDAYTGHTENLVRAIVELADGRLASAGFDGTVQVWDPDRPDGSAAIHTGHPEGAITVVALSDGRVASGGFEGAVQIWNPDRPDTIEATYAGHEGSVAVRVIELSDGRVVSGGADATVQVWDPDRS